MVLAIGLGLASPRPSATPSVLIDLVRPASGSGPVATLLASKDAETRTEGDVEKVAIPGRDSRPKLEVRLVSETDEAMSRIKTGKAALLVHPDRSGAVRYEYDPTRPEASAARSARSTTRLQAANGRKDLVATSGRPRDRERVALYRLSHPRPSRPEHDGRRPLQGVGFLIVNFPIAKLLKRFMATPMPRRNFLLAILGARLTFLVPDVGVLLALGYFGFGMPIRGSLWLLARHAEIIGALAFAGIGLLIASRAKTTETVSGLMNLVMLPMWIFSGLFFSSERPRRRPSSRSSRRSPAPDPAAEQPPRGDPRRGRIDRPRRLGRPRRSVRLGHRHLRPRPADLPLELTPAPVA